MVVRGVAMIAIGIDPGVTGAIAAYCTARGLLASAKLPVRVYADPKATIARREVDHGGLRALLQGWSAKHDFAGDYVLGAVERITARPGAQALAMLSLGHSCGVSVAVLGPFVRDMLRPTPSQWKRAVGVTAVKATSVAAVQTRLGIKAGHDRAEAILLALWAAGGMNGHPAAIPAPQQPTATPDGSACIRTAIASPAASQSLTGTL